MLEHITVSLDAVLDGIAEKVEQHILEWRDSVEVEVSYPVVALLDFSSSVYPGKNNPPVEAVMHLVFDKGVRGVLGEKEWDVLPHQVMRIV
ncbi:hypothetical protein [Streptomyces sp. NPDC006631]|uniref:hypothetical protein n=1 Tax=Streptomyces sp. NPDC006631 TaxID=3364752 RepID=UPI00367FB8ED